MLQQETNTFNIHRTAKLYRSPIKRNQLNKPTTKEHAVSIISS